MVLVKIPSVTPSLVFVLNEVVGYWAVLQITPSAITVPPPSAVISPPPVTVVELVTPIAVVVMVAKVASVEDDFLQLANNSRAMNSDDKVFFKVLLMKGL